MQIHQTLRKGQTGQWGNSILKLPEPSVLKCQSWQPVREQRETASQHQATYTAVTWREDHGEERESRGEHWKGNTDKGGKTDNVKKKGHCFDWRGGVQGYGGISSMGSIFRSPFSKQALLYVTHVNQSSMEKWGKQGERLWLQLLFWDLFKCVCVRLISQQAVKEFFFFAQKRNIVYGKCFTEGYRTAPDIKVWHVQQAPG